MPDNFDEAMNRGVACLRSGEHVQAQIAFQSAVSLQQDHPLAHFHLGLALHQLGRLAQAITCYEHALQLHADLIPAINNMGLARLECGDSKRAISAFERVVALEPGHVAATYNLGRAYQLAGQLREAVGRYEQTLRLNPGHAMAAANLASCQQLCGNMDAAEQAIAHALTVAPEAPFVHEAQGRIHYAQDRLTQACESFRTAIELDPNFVDAHKHLAEISREMRAFEAAESHYKKVLEIDPDCLVSITGLAVLYEQRGDEKLVGEMIAKGLEQAPLHPYLNLVAAKRERNQGDFEHAVTRLEDLLEADLDREFQAVYHLEIGQLYDRLAEYPQAMSHWREGNAIHQAIATTRGINANRFIEQTTFLIDNLLAQPGVTSEDSPTPQESPVFAVGFPRSGTTLLNRVLDSHPAFSTLEERPALAQVESFIHNHRDRFPLGAASIGVNDAIELRALYFNAVANETAVENNRQLVDKFPLNTMKLPLILRLFPRAKIIYSLRHPCDVCLSCLMQNFDVNSAMAHFFTLTDAANLYVRAARVWQRCLTAFQPRHHIVRYESLVTNFEREMENLLEFLEVERVQGLSHFDEQTQKTWVTTPSYHQVRQPIYQHASYRWRHYQQDFVDVLPILKPAIETFGYADEPDTGLVESINTSG